MDHGTTLSYTVYLRLQVTWYRWYYWTFNSKKISCYETKPLLCKVYQVHLEIKGRINLSVTYRWELHVHVVRTKRLPWHSTIALNMADTTGLEQWKMNDDYRSVMDGACSNYWWIPGQETKGRLTGSDSLRQEAKELFTAWHIRCQDGLDSFITVHGIGIRSTYLSYWNDTKMPKFNSIYFCCACLIWALREKMKKLIPNEVLIWGCGKNK